MQQNKYFKKENIWNIWTDKYLFKSSQISTRRRILSVIFFIIIGLLLSLIIISSLGIRTQNFFLIFTNLFKSTGNTQNFIYQIAIYTLAGLAFSFAMNVGIFNIGISGQMMAGASTAFLIINAIPTDLTSKVGQGGQIITVLLCIIGATAVALTTGLLKIYLKVNEVVSAILLNWIVLFIVGYLIYNFDLDEKALNNGSYFQSNPLPPGFSFLIPSNGSSNFILGSGWLWSIVFTVITILVIWFLMKFTVFGHKLKTTGLSSTSAKYFGYNENVLQLSSFAISGVIAGILGAVVYTGQSNYLNFNTSGGFALNATPPEGFNGIAIGLIALNNPIAIFIISILFSFINVGAAPAGLPSSTISLVTGIMMYIIAIYQLSLYLKPWRWYYLSKYGKINSENYLNFENYMGSNVERYYFNIAKQKNEIVNKKLFGDSLEKKSKWNTWILKIYYKWLGIYFLKNENNEFIYKLKKQEIYKEYFERKKEIKKEFNYSCAYNFIIEYTQKIDNNKIPSISSWNKDKKRIKEWTLKNLNPDILKQLEKHTISIDSKIKQNAIIQLINIWNNQILNNKTANFKNWKLDLEKMNKYLLSIDDIEVRNMLLNKIEELKENINKLSISKKGS
ncbi:ABC transporter permease [Mycoplasmoides pirum]|uniref:ABC transporter permease n=1 Tax=Mycoplasmoides pirum TaxID=2122 RepID=UPI000696E266|nr:ABC transporter permease [Mycoplasmoides pirum]